MPPSPLLYWVLFVSLDLVQAFHMMSQSLEFICTSALLCPENAVSLKLSTTSMVFTPPLLHRSLHLEGRRTVIKANSGLNIPTFLAFMLPSCGSLC